jgi:hypothetical protein
MSEKKLTTDERIRRVQQAEYLATIAAMLFNPREHTIEQAVEVAFKLVVAARKRVGL